MSSPQFKEKRTRTKSHPSCGQISIPALHKKSARLHHVTTENTIQISRNPRVTVNETPPSPLRVGRWSIHHPSFDTHATEKTVASLELRVSRVKVGSYLSASLVPTTRVRSVVKAQTARLLMQTSEGVFRSESRAILPLVSAMSNATSSG